MGSIIVGGSGPGRKPEHAPAPEKGEGTRVLVLWIEDNLKHYGVGTYVGKHNYPYSAKDGGSQWHRAGVKNPKIILDGDGTPTWGNVIWGCECWWWPILESHEGIAVACPPADEGLVRPALELGLSTDWNRPEKED